jgi:hypothetical protein
MISKLMSEQSDGQREASLGIARDEMPAEQACAADELEHARAREVR